MARIAFYAPLKSPNHPVPSGEREMARNLMAALQSDGHQIDLVSEFRSLEKAGSQTQQNALVTSARAETAALVARGGWDAWVTYHSYYKAPDLIGPDVCDALDIPYAVIEATRASKRLSGPWADFERRAAGVCDRADVLFYLTERDAVALREHLRPHQNLVHLPPFLNRQAEAKAPQTQSEPIILLVGMMRPGDKLASYKRAAEILMRLGDGDWRVEIAGDGPARSDVETLMSPLGKRVTFLGQLDAAGVQAAYARARAFLWPGVNEAFGMVYLEAQSAGVPVVAEDRYGVRDVVHPEGVFPPDDDTALAQELQRLLNDPNHHKHRAHEAHAMIAKTHLIGAARDILWGALAPLIPEAT
ncbi:glycosyltransferase family 4 protein [Shimia sp.]|uniref:glycosyltransferase family 4 protein n=1 Tax=Shimia sp. TaxID=1954381 RepID=UPI00329A23AC